MQYNTTKLSYIAIKWRQYQQCNRPNKHQMSWNL